MTLFSELSELMIRYRFKPDFKYSQNFLVSESLIEKIVSVSQIKKTDVVLEIGSGTGFLTRALAQKAKLVIAVEADLRLVRVLQGQSLPENVSLIDSDFLTALLPPFNRVIASPPYHLSTDLLYRLFSLGFDDAYLVLQKEFVERVTAEPGFFDFNALSVVTQYFCEPKIAFSISPVCFFPRPSGESVLVHFKSKKRFGSVSNEPAFIEFVNQLFRYKNKSFANALSLAWPFLKKKPKKSLEQAKKALEKNKVFKEKISQTEVKKFVQVFNELY